MTDTPGWAPPGSPEPPREDGRPGGGPSAPDGASGPSAPQDGIPGPSAPPPGSPGRPGWGAAPGWGQPYPGMQPYPGTPWGAPLAPKPGVIPLRPLGTGEILDGAVSTARRYWRTALGVSVVVAVVTTLITTLIDWGVTTGVLSRGGASLSDLLNYILRIVAGEIAGALLTMVVSRAVLGRAVSVREAWRDARPRLLPLLGLVLVMVLAAAVVAGVLLLPGILAAVTGADGAVVALAMGLGMMAALGCLVWLWIRYSLAPVALMLEKQGIRSSLSRSARLVRGSWWRIFGITLLGALVTGTVSLIIVLPALIIGLLVGGTGSLLDPSSSGPPMATLVIVGIGSAIASTLTLPVTAGINVLLYVDQRIRREALDIELARAAGLPGFGDAPAAPSAAPGA